jgi:anti-anti-sigma factor
MRMSRSQQAQLEIATLAPQAAGILDARLRGSLDGAGALALGAWLDEMISAGNARIRLDLRQVDFVASSGVGCLVAATGELRDEGGDLLLRGVSGALREMLTVLDLLDYLALQSD